MTTPKPAQFSKGNKAAKYSRKYYAELEADKELRLAARDTFRRILSGAMLPKMDAQKQEQQRLSAEKKAACNEYRTARKGMHELITSSAWLVYRLVEVRMTCFLYK